MRTKNIIPGIVYGHGFSSQNIEFDKNLFKKVFDEVGENTIVDLLLEGEKQLKALIHKVQLDPITEEIIHVDFYQIKEKEKVAVDVEINFIGEAPVVKEEGGVLVHNLSKLKIEALPKDLIHEIDVDVSVLKNFDDLIRVKDIKISSSVKILQEPDDVIVSISSPRREEEVIPASIDTTEIAQEKEEGTEVKEKKETTKKETEK